MLVALVDDKKMEGSSAIIEAYIQATYEEILKTVEESGRVQSFRMELETRVNIKYKTD